MLVSRWWRPKTIAHYHCSIALPNVLLFTTFEVSWVLQQTPWLCAETDMVINSLSRVCMYQNIMFCTLNLNAFCQVYLAKTLVLIPTEYHYPLLSLMIKNSMLMVKVSTQWSYDSDPSQKANLTRVVGGIRNRERARMLFLLELEESKVDWGRLPRALPRDC